MFAKRDTVIPDTHRDLLERPLFGHVGTLRDDGAVQVNPMWFSFDGERLWFTTTTSRRKHRNVLANPVLTVSVQDPELPYRYLEVRGVVEEIRPDPEAELFLALSERYGLPADGPPPDAGERVAYAVRPLRVSCQ